MPAVTVIIPVYNTEKYLPECLESATSQTFADIEILCVNDGSTDSSGDILREYARRDGRITVVEQENQGVSCARNIGLSMASGEYVLFLDSDDFFEPTAIEEAHARCVEDDAEIGIFRYRYVHADKGGSTEADWSLRMDLVPGSTPFSRREVTGSIFALTTPCVWNQMYKRSFIVDVGLRFLPELRRAEDLPFTYLALTTARRITVVDKTLMNYRTGIASSMQATIHEAPNEICRALELAKRAVIETGVFDEVERDFASAALDQCLFTLKTIRTVEAFRELYDELKHTYFAVLGIDGRTENDFRDRQHAQYLRIKAGPADAYLFDEDRFLRNQMASRLDEIRSLRNQRDENRDLLGRTAAALDEARAQLKETATALDRTRAQHEKTAAKLKGIRESRSYRTARRMASISRKIRRVFTLRRKAE